MRFIHTADWHLGRLFHGTHLTSDQAYVLDQLVDVAKQARPDAVIVAGDVYDRAVPPPDAVELLDDVLSRLVLDLQLPVILIAGNHDSPGRLNFGARLLAGRRLYVTGNLTKSCEPVVLNDGHGAVHVHPLPYAEPAVVRACMECGEGEAADHDGAMKLVLDRLRTSYAAKERRILVGHAFVAGGAASESERPLSVGGAGTVSASHFHGFEYVALGHLHSPQSMAADGSDVRTIHYCGSLMKYSFDEAGQTKGLFVVEMDGSGRCTQETVALRPRRDVRRVRGLLADLLKAPPCDDYLEITLLDEQPVLDPMGQLRPVYPNVMVIGRDQKAPAEGDGVARPNVRTTSDVDLFKSFYRHVAGDDLTEAQLASFVATVDGMQAAEREVKPEPAKRKPAAEVSA